MCLLFIAVIQEVHPVTITYPDDLTDVGIDLI